MGVSECLLQRAGPEQIPHSGRRRDRQDKTDLQRKQEWSARFQKTIK